MKNKENYFIKQFKKNSIIGDDGAVIKKIEGEQLVYSMDAFFENVHFKTEWMSLDQISAKSMLVNISDCIAMNAKPKYALLTVAIPPHFEKEELKKLAKGFKDVAKQFDLKIIGGDTISNNKLDISITIIGTTNNPIYRSGVQYDDLLCYTGELGTVKKDLESLLDGKKVSKKSKFIKPKLNPEFFYEIAPYINSALDISDGLGFELQRLSKINKVGFEFLKPLKKEVFCSGEEYEILFAFNKKHMTTIRDIAAKHNVDINIFAKAIEGKYKHNCKEHHFG